MIDREAFEELGFAMTGSLLSSNEIAALIDQIEQATKQSAQSRGGVRDVMDYVPALQSLSRRSDVREIVEQVLGSDAFVVRSTLFDKTDSANWKVPWHQDLTIAVSERRNFPGYGAWSVKSGVVHVQPPTDVLQRMVTVRIHLDACPATNGALRVIPGSHSLGRINQNEVAPHVNEAVAVTCEASAGEALVMRPLLLHASSASKTPGHRRVVHFDFATGSLAEGMSWRMR